MRIILQQQQQRNVASLMFEMIMSRVAWTSPEFVASVTGPLELVALWQRAACNVLLASRKHVCTMLEAVQCFMKPNNALIAKVPMGPTVKLVDRGTPIRLACVDFIRVCCDEFNPFALSSSSSSSSSSSGSIQALIVSCVQCGMAAGSFDVRFRCHTVIQQLLQSDASDCLSVNVSWRARAVQLLKLVLTALARNVATQLPQNAVATQIQKHRDMVCKTCAVIFNDAVFAVDTRSSSSSSTTTTPTPTTTATTPTIGGTIYAWTSAFTARYAHLEPMRRMPEFKALVQCIVKLPPQTRLMMNLEL
jgi:hypothetical protein